MEPAGQGGIVALVIGPFPPPQRPVVGHDLAGNLAWGVSFLFANDGVQSLVASNSF
jgi:hypothetical protein